MSKKSEAAQEIFSVSLALFARNGYTGTSIRQIASEAGISVGLTHHYFGNKERLGRLALVVLSENVAEVVNARVTFDEDPILNDLLLTRCNVRYMLNGPYRRFYLDSLREDLFFNALLNNEARLLNELQRRYGFESTPDLNLLYNKYIPYNVEKTIVLKKEEGLFPTIDYEEIPWHICSASMGKFIPESLLLEKDAISRRISEEVQQQIPSEPSDALIAHCLHRSLEL